MRIVFCGGGTMGHISPALAIAEKIKKCEPSSEILFIGRKNGEENKAVKNHGFNIIELEIYGIQRKASLKNFENIRCALEARKKSETILKNFNPDAVFGTGGYVSWPVIKSAQKLKIPNFMHESNAVAGMSTKLLASKCNKIFLNLKGSEKCFSRQGNLEVVGNPVREEFFNINRSKARKDLGIKNNEVLVLSFGGSGGSERMNTIIPNTAKNILSKFKHVKHIHATGKKYFEKTNNKEYTICQNKKALQILPYIENMPLYFSAADIIISRAGAMSVAEICATAKASILIPSPNVTGNHQYKNAKLLSDKNATVLIEEKNLTLENLENTLKELIKNSKLRNEISKNCARFYIKNSADLIYEKIKSTIEAE